MTLAGHHQQSDPTDGTAGPVCPELSAEPRMRLDSRSQTSSSTLDVPATLRRVRRRGRPRPDRTLSGSIVRSTAPKTQGGPFLPVPW